MKFEYFAGEQRTPEWFELRRGKVTASRLEDWLSVSKAKNTPGKPLKARLDYEKEIMFERTFGKSFDNYVTPAMQDGIDYEGFARDEYTRITGNKVEEVGAWYNEYFCASPDGSVGADGLIEIKVLKDNSFCDVLMEGVPSKHWKQCQGQLWASGRKWCDYVAINLNTGKLKIVRVLPDPEFHEWLELAVPEKLTVEPFSDKDVHDLSTPTFDVPSYGITYIEETTRIALEADELRDF